jgi:hypothetical protein
MTPGMHTILGTADLDGAHSVFPRNPADKGPQAFPERGGDEGPPFLGAEDAMIVRTDVGHGCRDSAVPPGLVCNLFFLPTQR